jgi:plasmid stabilization system protein ParE
MKLEWSPRALADLGRFAEFLKEDHPGLAAIIAGEIASRALVLETQPNIGRASPGNEKFRAFIAHVGGAAYVLQYRPRGERIIVVRVFHAREHRP